MPPFVTPSIAHHDSTHIFATSTSDVHKSIDVSGGWSAGGGFHAGGGGCITTPQHEICIGGHTGNDWGVVVGGSSTSGNTTIGGSLSGGHHGISGGSITGTIRW